MRKRRFFLIILLVLLAMATRLFGIQAQSIWFDEGWSAYAAQQPTLIDAINADLTNPPLYYVLLNMAARLWGDSEFGLRFFSLLAGILTIPLVYRLARTIGGSRGGIYAAVLATISAPLWWASQEARMYTLLALLIVIAALAWGRLITKPSRAAWIALWIAELGLLYAHNTGPVAAMWLNAVTLLAWVVGRADRPDWRLWIAGQVGVGVLWLPYFVTRFLLVQGANSAITSAPEISLGFMWDVWQGLWVAPWALALADLPAFAVLCAILLIVVIALVRRRALWLIAHAVMLTVGLIGGLMVLGNDLHGRYLVMIAPLLVAAVGVGIARLRRGWMRYAALAPFALVFALDVIAAQNPDYGHDDARAMAQVYADQLDAGDSVIAWSYADRYDLAYYWDRLGVAARRITLAEGAELDAVLPLMPAGGDVALNVWYTQRADYRGMMGCVLGNGTINAPEQRTVYGMTTLIYRDPALELPALQPVEMVFSDGAGHALARVDAVGEVSAATPDKALCLLIQITLMQATNAELKAALIVENDLGWEIARADAVFATANQRTGAAVAVGESLTAYPLLRLPYGAPAGDYRIFLRLYDEAQYSSGYVPPQGAITSGRDALLATWTALDGADWGAVGRASELPNTRELAVSDDLVLAADNLNDGVLVNGDEIRAALLWRGSDPLPDLELVAEDGAWRVDVPPRLEAHDAITLDWRAVRVPVDATSGMAALRIEGGREIARYEIESLPMITEAPFFAHEVGVEFPDVGELVGYTLSDPPFSRENPPELTLVWRAGGNAPPISYTVFAQLIDAQGRVIAQDDAIPGGRETTGWRAGEYIVDSHELTYNDNAAPGDARLIVGLYDAETNNRVRLADGTDAVILAEGLAVR